MTDTYFDKLRTDAWNDYCRACDDPNADSEHVLMAAARRVMLQAAALHVSGIMDARDNLECFASLIEEGAGGYGFFAFAAFVGCAHMPPHFIRLAHTYFRNSFHMAGHMPLFMIPNRDNLVMPFYAAEELIEEAGIGGDALAAALADLLTNPNATLRSSADAAGVNRRTLQRALGDIRDLEEMPYRPFQVRRIRFGSRTETVWGPRWALAPFGDALVKE